MLNNNSIIFICLIIIVLYLFVITPYIILPLLKKKQKNAVGGKYINNFCGYFQCINLCNDEKMNELDSCNIKFNNIKDYLNFNNVKNYNNCSEQVINNIDLSSESIKKCCSEGLIKETCDAIKSHNSEEINLVTIVLHVKKIYYINYVWNNN